MTLPLHSGRNGALFTPDSEAKPRSAHRNTKLSSFVQPGRPTRLTVSVPIRAAAAFHPDACRFHTPVSVSRAHHLVSIGPDTVLPVDDAGFLNELQALVGDRRMRPSAGIACSEHIEHLSDAFCKRMGVVSALQRKEDRRAFRSFTQVCNQPAQIAVTPFRELRPSEGIEPVTVEPRGYENHFRPLISDKGVEYA